VLGLSIVAACTGDNMSKQEADNTVYSKEDMIGQWKLIEEDDPWEHLFRPVDYYEVWEFFPNETVKIYHNSNNIDERFKTYELKSDTIIIYYDNRKDIMCCAHGYRCRFIDVRKNKVRMELVLGNITDMIKPLVWIYERVNK
jgi:hypothetical protein